MNTNLEYVTTGELIKELSNRCDSIVLAYDLKADKELAICMTHRGPIHAKIGLAHMLLQSIDQVCDIEHT